jgi:hypothetical protein
MLQSYLYHKRLFILNLSDPFLKTSNQGKLFFFFFFFKQYFCRYNDFIYNNYKEVEGKAVKAFHFMPSFITCKILAPSSLKLEKRTKSSCFANTNHLSYFVCFILYSTNYIL